MKEALSYPHFTDGEAEVRQYLFSLEEAGSLGPESSVVLNTPALVDTDREDQLLSLPEFLNFSDSLENLLKAVY